MVPFICVGSQCWLAPYCFLLRIEFLGGSFHLSWFPVLFGSRVLCAQNQHFGWFTSLFMVPSVVWLQGALCSKSTFWVGSFTFHGSHCCLAPTCFPLKIQYFKWFPYLLWFPVLSGSNVSLKINALGGSLHSSWFLVLFSSKVFSAQNQYFGWFPSSFCGS